MLYDYECKNCGIFELKQDIFAEPYKICPKCGDKVRRLISPQPRTMGDEYMGDELKDKGVYHSTLL